MSYAGYRIIMNGVTIHNSMISKGSFQITPGKRIAATWTDANLVEHQEVLSNPKMNISFNIRERNLNEQISIKGIFALKENIPVTYWDDESCEYKTGMFYMDAPQISHRNTIGGINYNATKIQLHQY